MEQSKQRKSNAGRKWFDGKDEKAVVAKLESVAAIDGSVEEMCSYAEISRESFFRYQRQHAIFRQRIEDLRQKPILKARNRLVQGIDESFGNAMDYLKRKRKIEFGDNVAVGIDPTLQGLLEKANKLIP